MLSFIPHGAFGVVVVILLVLVALVTVAVLTAATLGRRQDCTVLEDPGPQQDRLAIKP